MLESEVIMMDLIACPGGWEDYSDHLKIAEKLETRGYNQGEIGKVMGKNILRVLEEINY